MAKPLTKEEMDRLKAEFKVMEAKTDDLNKRTDAFRASLRLSLYGTSTSARTGAPGASAGAADNSIDVKTDPGTGAGQTKANI